MYEKESLGFHTPHPVVLIQWYRLLRYNSVRQPINNTSRVPAYLHGRKMAVSAFSCVEPSNIGEGRDGVDVSLLLSLRQRK